MQRYLIVLMVLSFVGSVKASGVTIPNAFTAGTPAVAEDVNENFSNIKNAIDDNFDRIDRIKKDGSDINFSAPSCLYIKENNPDSADGVYWLDPDGGARINAFQAFCDMTYRDGGWTLVGVDVQGDTSVGRLKSDYRVKGSEVVTCNSVTRGWDTSCWRLHRNLLSNTTEILIKGGLNRGEPDLTLAYSMARIRNAHPDDRWTLLVGNPSWFLAGAELFNFSTDQWELVDDDSSNCNHHSKINKNGTWIHWNTGDTRGCGGAQSELWSRNDIGDGYVDQTTGDSTNRHANINGMMLEIWIRGN